MSSYVIGNQIRVSAAFANSVGVAVDPTVVKCQVYTPAEVATTYTYGVDLAVVRDSAGHYHLDVDANLSGVWRYRWYSTGTGQAAAEGSFDVPASVFA